MTPKLLPKRNVSPPLFDNRRGPFHRLVEIQAHFLEALLGLSDELITNFLLHCLSLSLDNARSYAGVSARRMPKASHLLRHRNLLISKHVRPVRPTCDRSSKRAVLNACGPDRAHWPCFDCKRTCGHVERL